MLIISNDFTHPQRTSNNTLLCNIKNVPQQHITFLFKSWMTCCWYTMTQFHIRIEEQIISIFWLVYIQVVCVCVCVFHFVKCGLEKENTITNKSCLFCSSFCNGVMCVYEREGRFPILR